MMAANQNTSKAETGGADDRYDVSAVDRRKGGEAAPARPEGRRMKPAVTTGHGGLAAGGLSASPAKLSQRRAA